MTELKTVRLRLPASTADLAVLEIGTVVYLDGRLFTAREGVYKRAVEDGFGMPASPDGARACKFSLLAGCLDQCRRQHDGRRGDRDGLLPFRQMAGRLVQGLATAT